MYRNEVTLEGDLAGDPRVRTTKSGIQVANVTLRVEREREQPGDSSPEFLSVICWRQLSEVAVKLHKGDHVLVQAYAHTYKTIDLATNRTRYGTEIVAVSLEPLTLRTPLAEAAR